jgi:hypothetical protein
MTTTMLYNISFFLLHTTLLIMCQKYKMSLTTRKYKKYKTKNVIYLLVHLHTKCHSLRKPKISHGGYVISFP